LDANKFNSAFAEWKLYETQAKNFNATKNKLSVRQLFIRLIN